VFLQTRTKQPNLKRSISETFWRKQMPLVPYVVEDTPRGERGMDIFARLLRERVVFIHEPISDPLATVRSSAVALSGKGRSGTRHRHLHQLAGRFDLRGQRDLRHHPNDFLPRRHHLHWLRGFVWRAFAVRRRAPENDIARPMLA
jgi:hypothetical protein